MKCSCTRSKKSKKNQATIEMPKVVFSDRAMAALMTETRQMISTETGGVFLGHKQDDVWYIIESIDPGPNSVFLKVYFEYDTPYINHLINKINKLYHCELDLIGLWHRHPGSLDTFTSTDDGTNTEYAKLNPGGAISALVNIDPEFRLTMYGVTLPLQYQELPYEVGDDKIPAQYLEYISMETTMRQINNAHARYVNVNAKPKEE